MTCDLYFTITFTLDFIGSGSRSLFLENKLPVCVYTSPSPLYVNAITHCLQTALLHAAKHNHHLMVADLIHLGADVNATNDSGKSCLHLSAENGYVRVLEVRAVLSNV